MKNIQIVFNSLLNAKVYISFVCLFCLSITVINAQETISATGGNASGSGGSVSFTIGQIANSTFTGPDGSVAQGVQQPYEISIVTGIDGTESILFESSVYPNPVTDLIKLKIEDYEIKNLRYQLYDVNGILLQNAKVEENETSINLSSLLPGTYFLKLVDNTSIIKTFKIIKN